MTEEWLWTYDGYDPERVGLVESLCTLGNGYFATRGALPECSADGVHYPGTYVAGVFNRLTTEIAARTVDNESVVNMPNWLWLTFTADDGTTFDPTRCEVLSHRVELDIRRAVLLRQTAYRHPDGRVLRLTQRRFVSLRDPHLAGLETTLVGEGWSGRLTVKSAIDGTVRNSGVDRYDALGTDHLMPVASYETSPEGISLEVETSSSHVRVAETARTRVLVDGQRLDVVPKCTTRDRWVDQTFEVELEEDRQLVIEKVVALFTSRDLGIYEPRSESEHVALEAAGGFEELLERHVVSWRHAWNRSRIDIGRSHGHTSKVLNLHILHLLQTTSRNSTELDVGVPARGLNGEAYRGHIFWDELFIFPFLNLRVPELTRALLRYRARRLDRARYAATQAGFRGAMFPWQSASSGREETQTMHLNPESGRWLADASHLQRHVNAAIVYNIWSYWQVTADMEFMRFWGAEMVLEIARFWASSATYNHALDRYEIKGVMGPDEYHVGYPDRAEPGLDNNTYTNVMAVWCILRAFDTLNFLPPQRSRELAEKLAITPAELDRWGDITRKMRICFHDGKILSQFEGYEDLEELDWEKYRKAYPNIQRLDRILEAEGDTPNRYKLAKQPDALMLFYLLSVDELRELLDHLGYEWDDHFVERNVEYYTSRTSHGSTLSQMIQAWIYSKVDMDRAWTLFREALLSDVADIQGGTTREGIHLGAMAGSVDLVQRCFTGIEMRQDKLILNPNLPPQLDAISFPIRYRGHPMLLSFSHDAMCVEMIADGGEAVTIEVFGKIHEVTPGNTLEIRPEGAEEMSSTATKPNRAAERSRID